MIEKRLLLKMEPFLNLLCSHYTMPRGGASSFFVFPLFFCFRSWDHLDRKEKRREEEEQQLQMKKALLSSLSLFLFRE